MSILAVWSVYCSVIGDADTRKQLVAIWSVAPPIYFFFEFHWAKYRKPTEEIKANINDVKESQDMASKIWAGLVAALAVLFLK